MVEYAVIVAVIAAAVGAMGVFFKGALQKRIFSLGQELSSRAYAPRMTTSSSQASATSTINESYAQGIRQVEHTELTQRSGDETVLPERMP